MKLDQKKYLIIAAIAIVGIIVMIAIPLISNLLTPTFNITNIAEVPQDLRLHKKDLEQNIFLVLEENHYTNGKSVSGKIRTDTLQQTSEVGATSWDFLIDMDDIKLTYSISYYVPNDKQLDSEDIMVSCPQKSESKYPSNSCRSMYDNSESLEETLPYFIDQKGESFAILAPGDSDNELLINIFGCSTLNKDEMIEKSKTWVDSFFINPDSFTYKVECKSN